MAFLDAVANRLDAPAVSGNMLAIARSAHRHIPTAPINNVQSKRDASIPTEEPLIPEAATPSVMVEEIQEQITVASLESTTDEPCSNGTIESPDGVKDTPVIDGEFVEREIGLASVNSHRIQASNGAANPFLPNGFDQISPVPVTSSINPSSDCSVISIMTDTNTGPTIHRANIIPNNRHRRATSTSSTTSTHSSNASSITMTCTSSDSENGKRQVDMTTAPTSSPTLLRDDRAVPFSFPQPTPSSPSSPSSSASSSVSSSNTPTSTEDATQPFTLLPADLYVEMLRFRLRYAITFADDAGFQASVGSAAAENGQVRAYRPNLYQVASLVKEESKIADDKPDASSSSIKQSAEAAGDGFDDLVRQHEMFHKKREERAAQRSNQKSKKVKKQTRKKKKKSRGSENHTSAQPEPMLVAPAATHPQVDSTNAEEKTKPIKDKSIEAAHSDGLFPKQQKKKRNRKSRNNQPRPSAESDAEHVEPAVAHGREIESVRHIFPVGQNGDETPAGKAETEEQSVFDIGHDVGEKATAIEAVHLDIPLEAGAPLDQSKLSTDDMDQVTAFSSDVNPVPFTVPLPVDTEARRDCDVGDVSNEHSPTPSLLGDPDVHVPANSTVRGPNTTASAHDQMAALPSVEPVQQQSSCHVETLVTAEPEYEAAVQPSTFQNVDVDASALDVLEDPQHVAAKSAPSELDSPGSSTGTSATDSTSVPFDLEAHVHYLLTRSLQNQQRQSSQDGSQDGSQEGSFLPPYDYGPWIHEEPLAYHPMQYQDSLYSFPAQPPKAFPPQYDQYEEYPQPQYYEPQYCPVNTVIYNGGTAMDRAPPAFVAAEFWSTGRYPTNLIRESGPGPEMMSLFCEPTHEAFEAIAARPFPDFWATRCWGRNGYVNRLNMKPWYLQPLVYEIEKQRARPIRSETKLEQQKRVFRKYGL